MTIKKKDRITSMYFITVMIGAVLILLSFLFYMKSMNSESKISSINPVSVEREADGKENFFFETEQIADGQVDIAFYTNHQFVKVYADGEMIYSLLQDGGILGHTTGSIWNFVQIPYGTKQLEVELTPAYKAVQWQDCTFYQGRDLDVFRYLFRKGLPSCLASILIIIMGVGMMLYWAVVHLKAPVGNGLLCLGGFSTLFGLWSANETDTVTLIFANRIGSYLMAYILLMTMGIPFALFVRDFLRIGDRKIIKAMCSVSIIEFFAVLLLQFANIRDMKETVFLTHGILCIALCYMVGCLIYKIIKHQIDRRVKISLLGMGLLVLATLTDIVGYYFRVGDADFFGRFVFLFFILMVGWEAAASAVATMEKGRKAKAYEELARTDTLTGLYNRNAYMEDTKKLKEYRNVMIVTFDLNNLKECNDHYGHRAGDRYLKEASAMIEKVFEQYGACYRIGGDEFCCVVKKAQKCSIEKCFDKLKEEENRYNSTEIKCPVHIACGYAVYDEQTDKNLEAVRDRSDQMMYQNKKELKRKMNVNVS